MQAIVKLPLKSPLELRMVEIPRMNVEDVGMHRDRGLLEIDCNFYPLSLRLRAEDEQGVFVKAKLVENTLQARVGHVEIVMKRLSFRA
jgi:hypothetical protein